MTTIAVTGATGFVGAAIAAGAREDGHEALAMSRRPAAGLDWRPYELDEAPAADLLRDVEIVVHCAYDLSLTRPSDVWRVNVQGTQQLVEAAAAAGARLVLISSMSAYPGSRQTYGRAKLAAERTVLDAGGTVARLGLVYGDDGKGMIGALERLVALPVTPLIGRHAYQFTVHVSDMAHGVLRLALDTGPCHEPIGLAHPRPVRFEDLLEGLAHRVGTSLRTIPMPWQAAYGAMRVAEAVGVPLPLRADSILGLVRPAPSVPRADYWAHLGVRIRSFEEWAHEIPALAYARKSLATDHGTLL